MSEVFFCPRCKSRVERPSPDIAKIWCWRCGKKLNFGKEPRRMERAAPDQPVTSHPPQPAAGVELPSAVAQASARRQMPTFGDHRYRQPTLHAIAQPYQPPRRSATLLFVSSALVSAIVVTLILIGYMIVIAGWGENLGRQSSLERNASPTDFDAGVNVNGAAKQAGPNIDSGSTVPHDASVLFPPRQRRGTPSNQGAGRNVPFDSETEQSGDALATNSNAGDATNAGNAGGAQARRPAPDPIIPPPRNNADPTIAGLNAVKQATALVVASKRRGTAFCIDDRGVFVTASPVIEGHSQGDIIRIVLNSGEASAKQYYARIALNDSRNNIALLTANSNSVFPVVKLGNVSRLQAGDDIAALGFPAAAGSFPPVRTTHGQVATIVRDSGVVSRMITGARLEAAGLGGPLMNRDGQVLGIVTTESGGSRVDATPIDQVQEVAEWTFAKLVAPVSISASEIRDPFSVHLDVFSPAETPFTAVVYVSVTKEEFPMRESQNHFSATIDLGGKAFDPRTVSSIRLIVRVFEGRQSGARDKRVLSLTHDIKIAQKPSLSKSDFGDRGKAQ